MLHLLAFQMPSFPEMLVIMAIGLLLFGKRLPEVGRSLGKGIVEFKKGLKGIEDDVDVTATQPPRQSVQTRLPEDSGQPAVTQAYKFDPYTGKPVDQATTTPGNT